MPRRKGGGLEDGGGRVRGRRGAARRRGGRRLRVDGAGQQEGSHQRGRADRHSIVPGRDGPCPASGGVYADWRASVSTYI